MPFIHDNNLMLQHDNTRPHVANICTQFLEAENIPILAWLEYSLNMSPFEHVWDANGDHTRYYLLYFFSVYGKCFRSLSSAQEKWEQKQKCCVYIFVQCTALCYSAYAITTLAYHFPCITR